MAARRDAEYYHCTLDEIAAEFGVSRARASQLVKEALEKCRNMGWDDETIIHNLAADGGDSNSTTN